MGEGVNSRPNRGASFCAALPNCNILGARATGVAAVSPVRFAVACSGYRVVKDWNDEVRFTGVVGFGARCWMWKPGRVQLDAWVRAG